MEYVYLDKKTAILYFKRFGASWRLPFRSALAARTYARDCGLNLVPASVYNAAFAA